MVFQFEILDFDFVHIVVCILEEYVDFHMGDFGNLKFEDFDIVCSHIDFEMEFDFHFEFDFVNDNLLLDIVLHYFLFADFEFDNFDYFVHCMVLYLCHHLNCECIDFDNLYSFWCIFRYNC